MRLYREFSQYATGSVRTAVNPTAVAAATYTLAGALVENLAPVNDGAVGRYRADTTDLLYTASTAYLVAWTATIGGVTFTRTVRYMHVTAGDVTGPGAPTIGDPVVTDTTAAFPFTAPTDADYDHVTIIAWPQLGGATASGTGTGASGTIPLVGLSPSTAYFWEACAYDTAGNPSVLAAGTAGSFVTRHSTTIEHPLYVKFYVNNEPDQHDRSPWPIDIEHLLGGFTIGDDRAPMGRGPVASILLENCFGNWWNLLDLTVRYTEPEQSPFGLGRRILTR